MQKKICAKFFDAKKFSMQKKIMNAKKNLLMTKIFYAKIFSW